MLGGNMIEQYVKRALHSLKSIDDSLKGINRSLQRIADKQDPQSIVVENPFDRFDDTDETQKKQAI